MVHYTIFLNPGSLALCLIRRFFKVVTVYAVTQYRNYYMSMIKALGSWIRDPGCELHLVAARALGPTNAVMLNNSAGLYLVSRVR